ncbi:MAG: cation diffusion facilitator family transporter [Candidatus Izemoplasmatales bacterium]|nr:cation diffusion facilitator family transporter [Candidatus Izemoplasmatales bacterium]MDD4354916.1 cation diffusion facilitator family transporter [Candidatus Izemoplasmatales bacterium]MDD4987739.1 cation diffusion facilitator family transporter [Candidatus Izemoplasmatales bacterium]MDY0372623.1 cation diffusion facilitator family transporter [Candidatus Izemoplasmatales bacterium]NLF48545.1 cation transporter [Acholeplasmataceae bacterium]
MTHKHSANRLTLAFFLNFFFTIIEIVGGILTNSIALISDAIHDLGDAVSIGLAVYFEHKASKKPDHEFTYGYHRYSLLGALIAAFGLVIGVIFIIIEAVKRIMNPEAINAELMIYFAFAGILINGIAAWHTQKGKTLSEKAVGLHLWEDVIGWALLLLASILMHYTDLLLIDAILSIGFSLFILFHVFRHLKKVIDVLMEKAPNEPKIEELRKVLMDTDGVNDIHHLHYWSLEGDKKLFTAHVVLEPNLDSSDTDRIQRKLHDQLHQLGIDHATLEFEKEDECMSKEDCGPLSDG